MKKVALIARREFTTAVLNKGFLIGLLLMPVLGVVLMVAAPLIFNPGPLDVRGELAIVDPTGEVLPEIRKVFDPAVVAARRDAELKRALADAPAIVRQVPGGAGSFVDALNQSAQLTIVELPSSSGADRETRWLAGSAPGRRRLAVAVVHPDAVTVPSGGKDGGYDLYVMANLEWRLEDLIQEGLQDAIVAARARVQQLDRERIEALLNVPRARPTVVDRAGVKASTSRGLDMVLPLVLAGLLVFGVVMGGQALLLSTVEEKSSRVIEVLLSAVSPMQFMAGKIIGHLAVILLVLTVYAGLGMLGLVAFALAGLLNPWLVVYLLAFFLTSFLLFGAVFAAAGAAVNDMKEAQTLLGPIMLLLVGPWLLAFPMVSAPDSTLATVLSFIPPVNAFAMMVRLGSSSPPPAWQSLLSLAISLAAAWVAVWFAAKIFRIGLLMHGRPPDLRTLIRWARAA